MSDNWVPYTIQDFIDKGEAELRTGPFGTQLKANEYVDEGTPVINVRNIGFGEVREDNLEFLGDETVQRLRIHLLEPGDIVFGRKGAVERHAFIQEKHHGWFQGSDCLRLRINSPQVEPRFLSYYFLTNFHKQWMINQCSHGATMASLNQAIISRIPLKLPAVGVQRRIAAILSAYDDLIENNMQRIRILEEMAQSLYREWFVHFRFPGHEDVPLVESELGPIPQGWEVVPVSAAIEINPRVKVPDEGEKPFIPMASLSETSMLITGIESRTGNSGAKFRNRDTLFARITPCLENGKTGFVMFLPTDDSVGFGSTEFVVMRSKALCPEYVYLLARDPEFRQAAAKTMTGASGRQRVQNSFFEEYLIVQPDRDFLTEFQVLMEPIFSEVHVLAQKNAVLRDSRDLLLPRLVSGEIDVSELQIEIDAETQYGETSVT